MTYANFRADQAATQVDNVVRFPSPQHLERLWRAEADLRAQATRAQSLEELQAIYARRFDVMQALKQFDPKGEFDPDRDPDPVPMSDAQITEMLLNHPDEKWREAGRTGKWKRVPSDVTEREDSRGPKPDAGVTPIKRPEPTDDQIADIFAEEHRHDLRYVAPWGCWYEWTGKFWRRDDTLRHFDLVRRTCKAHGVKKAGMAKMVNAVQTLARADRRIAATIEQWDTDRMLLNTPDGVLYLRDGTLRKSDPLAFCTKITAVGPRGDCPLFLKFLKRIMGGDAELVAYLQRVCGYCLSGDTSEQAMFFNYGVGSNGKSVLMSTVSGILSNYCIATPIETFTESKSDRHPTELARLRGARLVTATETEAGRHWAESRLKELTGGERIAARFMNQNFFEFQPAFKPWLSGNHKPRLRSVGLAMRRRVNMIPFAVIIPQDERDPQLVEKLKAEWPGILAWMIDGCLDWQERGLAPPEAVIKATDDYFASEDGFADWIADRCEEVRGHWSRSSELFASWRDYAEKAGLHAGDTKRFHEEMEGREFRFERNKRGRFFVGLCVRQDPPEVER
jgi:putative DNA primase/helicase